MLKSALGVVLLVSTVVMLVACSESANDVARLEHTAEARQITPLNTGWHFTLSEATPEGLSLSLWLVLERDTKWGGLVVSL